MKNIKNAALFAISFSFLVLGVGYSLVSIWFGSVISAGIGVLWIVGQLRGWRWVPSYGLVTSAALAATGTFLGVHPIWSLFGLTSALVAWDMGDFLFRTQDCDPNTYLGRITRNHLKQLFVPAGLGLILSGIGLGVQIQLSFERAFILGLILIFGLSQGINILRRERK